MRKIIQIRQVNLSVALQTIRGSQQVAAPDYYLFLHLSRGQEPAQVIVGLLLPEGMSRQEAQLLLRAAGE